jgi:hypothetical protein
MIDHTQNIYSNKYKEKNMVDSTQFDAKTRFERLAAKGDRERGLELLEKLEESFEKKSSDQ